MGMTWVYRPLLSQTVQETEQARAYALMQSQQAALRAPANRSKLTIKEQKIMLSIGQTAMRYTPEESAGRFEAANQAMAKFYSDATKRKGIVL